jgi:hypothetical protein
MTPIRKLLIGTALTTLSVAAFAQTPAPAAAGVDTPRQTPDIAGLRDEPAATREPQRLTAPGPTDPLVQKRDANARANATYRQDKKSARSDYKSQVKSARAQRKSERNAANDQMKDEMQGQPAQGGPQRP